MHEQIDRLAQLAVDLGANVQHDQVVAIGAAIGDETLARAVAERAYGRGAKFVDVQYFDPVVKRTRVARAREETLEFVPPWYGERVLALGREQAALIGLTPRVLPGLLADLDPSRAGKDALPALKETLRVINERSINWTIVPSPSTAWAETVYPREEGDGALARLWDEIVVVCRLDEPDPIAAWQSRMDVLGRVADRLTERRFDAVHFEGDGTDLTVGLLPTSAWGTARFSTRDGLPHLVNIPSEEVFTGPDPERVEGMVRATKPLELTGALVKGLLVRFEGGRAVSIEAEHGAEALRARVARDAGGSRLGEVALVDREGRVGQVGTTFSDTLLDENAASHVALGNAYAHTAGDVDRHRLNESEIHVDFMIGGDDVAVTGITSAGERVPVLRGGSWQL
jgi:aminopeptidase